MFTSPAVAITIAGCPRRLFEGCSQRRHVEAPDGVARQELRLAAADPKHAEEALIALAWRYPHANTGSGGSPAKPRVDVDGVLQTPPPARSRQADKVGCGCPDVNTALQSAGIPNRSLSQSRLICSRRAAKRRTDPVVRVLVQR